MKLLLLLAGLHLAQAACPPNVTKVCVRMQNGSIQAVYTNPCLAAKNGWTILPANVCNVP